MQKLANISHTFWLPLWCAALIFANISTVIPGSSAAFHVTVSDYQTDADSQESVLSAGYSKMAYLSKIAPEIPAKSQTEKQAIYFLFPKDGNPTPQNGTYLAISKSITPGLTLQKILYPFHDFL